MQIQLNTELIQEKAKQIRINALRMVHAANSGHPGGSLSIADILAVLYFGGHLRYKASEPEWSERDILIISKGHSSPAVYSALALAGFFDIADTLGFRKLGSPFQGHIDRCRVPGVEMSTGSLGHGLSNALGCALALRLDQSQRKVFAILSDGELQEGSNWEAIMAAAHYKTSQLVAFIDRNRIQLDGWTETTMGLDPIADKFKAFGWAVTEIDGHDIAAIDTALRNPDGDLRPRVIIANTIKGKGVSFMENQVKWHGVAPKTEELEAALEELEHGRRN